MPNWVENTLVIHKKHKDILLNENGELDFEKLIPMPESLNIVSGGNQHEAVALYLYRKRGESEKLKKLFKEYKSFKSVKSLKEFAAYLENENPDLVSLGEAYVTNKEKYGAETWYEWRNINWGCKWNASNSYVEEVGDLLDIHFSTPWGPPSSWLERLSKEAPFYLEWIEEQGYHGEYICDEKGHLLESDLPFFQYTEEMPDGLSEEEAEAWYDEDHWLSDEEVDSQYVFCNMRDDVLEWECNAESLEFDQDI